MKNTLFLLGTIFWSQLLISQIQNDMHFDGDDDYVNLNLLSPEMEALGDNFTIEFWTKYNNADNEDYGVIFSGNESSGLNRFLIRAAGPIDDTEGIVIYIMEYGENQYIRGNIVVGNDRCHHVALTYGEGVCSLYIDGLLDVTAVRNVEFEPGDRYSLGQEYDLGVVSSDFFEGELDDFRIWNVTKTAGEIFDFMDVSLTGTEANLVAYYDFNQGLADDDNTGIDELVNLVDSDLNGALNNFELLSSTSNFTLADCIASQIGIEDLADELDHQPTVEFLNDQSKIAITASILLYDVEVKVYNLMGEVIVESSIQSFESEAIDISALNAGLYLLTVGNGENRFVYKFVRN